MKNNYLKLTIIWGVIFTVILFMGCEKESSTQTSEKNAIDKNFVDLAFVSELAENIKFPDLDFDVTIKKSPLAKKVKHIKNITDEDSNILFYIVNYEEGGFAIFSADKRTRPILAYSETAVFPYEHENYPYGVKDWLSKTKKFIKDVKKANKKQAKEIARAWNSSSLDGLLMASLDPPVPDDDYYDDTQPPCEDTYSGYGPFLQTTWCQRFGFNDSVDFLNCSGGGLNGRAKTGCVATAMAQIMKYHNFPSSYNWSSMSNTCGTAETARLMRDIGIAVNMIYGCESSTANTYGIPPAFKNYFGYSTSGLSGYSVYGVEQEIKNSRPVILTGQDGAEAHAWVCDGYRVATYCFPDGTSNIYKTLHMNWGWGICNSTTASQYDGWYSYYNFNPKTHEFDSYLKMITIRK